MDEGGGKMIDLLIPKFNPAYPHSAVENMALLADKSEDDTYAFLHDDVEIIQAPWPGLVTAFFQHHPKCGMVGFGGALGLGTGDMYKRPYNLLQLARLSYISNMKEAELHGSRVIVPTQVSVLDGFCQIIRRTAYEDVGGWQAVLDMGIEFHAYDTAMACLLAEKGWEVWMLPIPCHHAGGRTSCSPEYDAWLRSRGINGDGEVHAKAHRIIYDRFRTVLPLRVR
jgi:Glycosyltransferase like family